MAEQTRLRPAGRPGRGRPRRRRGEFFRPRRPPDRRDYRAQRQARQRVRDRAAVVHAAVRVFSRPPGGVPAVPVCVCCKLVCMCLGLLWLRPRPVAAAVVAALTLGLAVVFNLALATR